jgi:hypothetical protein
MDENQESGLTKAKVGQADWTRRQDSTGRRHMWPGRCQPQKMQVALGSRESAGEYTRWQRAPLQRGNCKLVLCSKPFDSLMATRRVMVRTQLARRVIRSRAAGNLGSESRMSDSGGALDV